MRVHIPPFACPCCGETITIVRLRIEDDVVDGVEIVAGVAGWPKSMEELSSPFNTQSALDAQEVSKVL
jgi:hypothetical protein